MALTSEAVQTPESVDAQLSTQPAAVSGPSRGLPLLRWWRQLTSMRTALTLLFLLALAAVPGSTFPQRSLNQLKVDDYFAAHPKLAPILDRMHAFDVFSSPWFAAIYLLLFVSLIGCIVPRSRLHYRALRRRPPEAPRHLDRLPLHTSLVAAGDAPGIVAAGDAPGIVATVDAPGIAAALRRRRWRVEVREESGGAYTVSAEKGYLRETGNLVFHLSLVVVLAGIAVGGLWGWRAAVLTVEGGAFCNTVQAYDQFTPGALVRGAPLSPFCVALDDFRASYLPSGQPDDYAASVRHVSGADAVLREPDRATTVQVNHPLRVDGANVYLINHGYAPILRFTDTYGVEFTTTTPFLPDDLTLSSQGAVVLPDANIDPKGTKRARDQQVAFEGLYLPTMPADGPAVRSVFPAEQNPGLVLLAYRGDTGLNAGIPHSVYSLDQAQVRSGALKLVGNKLLRPGETWKLDDGSQVTFVGTREWASFQVGHDPGQLAVLVGAVAMVAGLLASLTVRRRRLWFRIEDEGGRTLVTAGGLARTDAESFAAEFAETVNAVTDRAAATPAPPGAPRHPEPEPIAAKD